jgi:hypothetical protein
VAAVLTLSVDSPAAGAARLVLAGHLDDEGARDVLHAAADVVRCGCERLVVDLDGITSYDAEAAFAVLGCWRLARYLPEGVALVAERATGRALADTAGVPEQGIMDSCRAS